MNVRKIALLGILTAATIIIAVIESFIPSIGIPGVKIGLANIMILVILYELGVLDAIIVNLSRVVLVGVIRGTIFTMGFLMSLTGAVMSLGIMILFYLVVKKFSVIGVSVIASIFHITGQILIAWIFLETHYILYYLPIIAISAIITGVLVGIVAQIIIKTEVIKKQREKYNF